MPSRGNRIAIIIVYHHLEVFVKEARLPSPVLAAGEIHVIWKLPKNLNLWQ